MWWTHCICCQNHPHLPSQAAFVVDAFIGTRREYVCRMHSRRRRRKSASGSVGIAAKLRGVGGLVRHARRPDVRQVGGTVASVLHNAPRDPSVRTANNNHARLPLPAPPALSTSVSRGCGDMRAARRHRPLVPLLVLRILLEYLKSLDVTFSSQTVYRCLLIPNLS